MFIINKVYDNGRTTIELTNKPLTGIYNEFDYYNDKINDKTIVDPEFYTLSELAAIQKQIENYLYDICDEYCLELYRDELTAICIQLLNSIDLDITHLI